jgi:hypothetical protein
MVLMMSYASVSSKVPDSNFLVRLQPHVAQLEPGASLAQRRWHHSLRGS